jgi:alkylhydroperoxidase/carboxymuconolactone decarboxylase family protein YurZ
MAIDMEQELERTTALRGFRFGLHDFVARLKGADALKKHNDAIEASYLKKGLLDRKTKELAIVVACVALKDSTSHLRCHMHAAKNAGATPEEILELIDCRPRKRESRRGRRLRRAMLWRELRHSREGGNPADASKRPWSAVPAPLGFWQIR